MYVIFDMDGWLIVLISINQIDQRTPDYCAFRVGSYLCNVFRSREAKANSQWHMFVTGKIAHTLNEFV
jgi:hypothetical protein